MLTFARSCPRLSRADEQFAHTLAAIALGQERRRHPACKTQGSQSRPNGRTRFSLFGDTQLGVRHDFSRGPSHEWAALGVQRIAPYWFDVECSGYAAEE